MIGVIGFNFRRRNGAPFPNQGAKALLIRAATVQNTSLKS